MESNVLCPAIFSKLGLSVMIIVAAQKLLPWREREKVIDNVLSTVVRLRIGAVA